MIMRHIKQISCFGMLLCGAFSVIAAPSANDGASGIKAQIAAERKGSAKVFEEALAATEAKVWKSTDGKTLPYRLHLPAKPERGRLYPLVVHMHEQPRPDQDRRGGLHLLGEEARGGVRFHRPADSQTMQVGGYSRGEPKEHDEKDAHAVFAHGDGDHRRCDCALSR